MRPYICIGPGLIAVMAGDGRAAATPRARSRTFQPWLDLSIPPLTGRLTSYVCRMPHVVLRSPRREGSTIRNRDIAREGGAGGGAAIGHHGVTLNAYPNCPPVYLKLAPRPAGPLLVSLDLDHLEPPSRVEL